MGGKIWVDKRVLLRHTGTYVFDYAAQEPLYKALHEMALANAAVNVVAAPPAAPAEPEVLLTNEVKAKPKKGQAKKS